MSEKYDSLNRVLIVLSVINLFIIVASIIFKIFTKSEVGILSSIYSVFFAIIYLYLICLKHGIVYRLISFMGIIVMIILIYNSEGLSFLTSSIFLLSIVFILVVAGLALFIGFKMFPYFGFLGPRKDSSGLYIYSLEELK